MQANWPVWLRTSKRLQVDRSTQRAVLQKKLFYSGYSAGKIDPALCVAGKMKYICWENFLENCLLNGHYRLEEAKIFLRTWDNLQKFVEIMDVRDETHIIHSCYAAGWEKCWCRLPESEEHLLIYQGRQLCDDKQAPSVLVNFKLIVRYF